MNDLQYDVQQKMAAAGSMMGMSNLSLPLSLIEKTESEIQRLEQNLANKKELLELLKSEPKIQRVMDLIMNGGY